MGSSQGVGADCWDEGKRLCPGVLLTPATLESPHLLESRGETEELREFSHKPKFPKIEGNENRL